MSSMHSIFFSWPRGFGSRDNSGEKERSGGSSSSGSSRSGRSSSSSRGFVVMPREEVRIEHYEIVTYGGLMQLAITELNRVAKLLEKTLAEEEDADQLLIEIAEDLNIEAKEEGEYSWNKKENDTVMES
jgi:hypothetical protein